MSSQLSKIIPINSGGRSRRPGRTVSSLSERASAEETSALEAAGVAGVAGSVVAPDGGCVGDDAQSISAGAGPLIGLVAGTSPSVEVMATPEDGGVFDYTVLSCKIISPPAVAA
jgi:hypothetical protein